MSTKFVGASLLGHRRVGAEFTVERASMVHFVLIMNATMQTTDSLKERGVTNSDTEHT